MLWEKSVYSEQMSNLLLIFQENIRISIHSHAFPSFSERKKPTLLFREKTWCFGMLFFFFFYRNNKITVLWQLIAKSVVIRPKEYINNIFEKNCFLRDLFFYLFYSYFFFFFLHFFRRILMLSAKRPF